MHDVLRARVMRKIESLPEEQVYQVLDYIEFLESRYAASDEEKSAGGFQRLGEGLEDRMRKRSFKPSNLREAFQVIAAADRALSGVAQAGRQLFEELAGGSGAGEARTDVGDVRPQGGDVRAGGGDVRRQGGDVRADVGDARAGGAGDSRAEGGDARAGRGRDAEAPVETDADCWDLSGDTDPPDSPEASRREPPKSWER